MNDQANKPTIIITGSNGFIGNAITKRLRSKYNVIGFDQKLPKESLAAANFEVDISSPDSIHKGLDQVRRRFGNKIASVIHLAAYYSFAEQDSPLYNKITVKGTECFLYQLKKFEVEQFIFSSTMLVHKPVEVGEKISADSPVSPSWAYPKSKIEAEKILREQHHPIPVVNLRIAGVYDDRCHSVPISNQIMRIYERQLSSRLYPGDQSKGQSFLHLDDLVDAIESTVEKRFSLPDHVNLLLGEPKAISYSHLQNSIAQLIHRRNWNSLKIPVWFAKAGAWMQHRTPLIRKPFIMPWMIDFTNDHYELDITRTEQLLDWKPKHEVARTIPSMIETLRENPLQFYKENKLKEASPLARTFGRMPGDETGFDLPSKSYQWQMDALILMNILWGLWLILDSVTRVTSTAMIASSVVSGVLVILFSALSYFFLWQWPRWITAFIGAWVLFAPLALWTKSAADYSGANLIGFLMILCGAFKPVRRDVILPREYDHPKGWDYNPSTWEQRLPIVTLAMLGFFIARYMAAYQLGHIPTVWDPIFGTQTATILTSDISKAFPVSDAGLGAFSYLLDAASGLIGDRHRYRTMPWMVMLFGFMIIPPGVTSIVLVILQPVAVNAWCFLCLLASVIMLLMVGPAIDEVVACFQFLRESKREGKPFWKTFLQGNPVTEQKMEKVEVEVLTEEKRVRPKIPMGIVGSILASVGLMFVPEIFEVEKPASNLIYFATSLIITFAIIAWAEVARPLRMLNIILSGVLIVGIWLLQGSTTEVRLLVSAISTLIIALSFPRGKFRHHFGNYDRVVQWSPL